MDFLTFTKQRLKCYLFLISPWLAFNKIHVASNNMLFVAYFTFHCSYYFCYSLASLHKQYACVHKYAKAIHVK